MINESIKIELYLYETKTIVILLFLVQFKLLF